MHVLFIELLQLDALVDFENDVEHLNGKVLDLDLGKERKVDVLHHGACCIVCFKEGLASSDVNFAVAEELDALACLVFQLYRIQKALDIDQILVAHVVVIIIFPIELVNHLLIELGSVERGGDCRDQWFSLHKRHLFVHFLLPLLIQIGNPLEDSIFFTHNKKMVQLQEKIFKLVLRLQGNVRLNHWATTSYNRHLITDKLYNELEPQLDQFVEVFLGKNERPVIKPGSPNMTVAFQIMSDDQFYDYIKKFIPAFIQMVDRVFDPKTDGDLMSIRDEIVATLNQSLYLMKARPC